VILQFRDPSFGAKQLPFDASQVGFVSPSAVAVVHIIPKKHPRRLASLLKASSESIELTLGIGNCGTCSPENAG
jgi:hypothetical protein